MDWELIQKMRQGFLDTDGHLPDYWQDERWLDAYEHTLAQRIRWKWQAVLEALREPLEDLRGISRIVDWGCGTGIATRSLLATLPLSKARITLYDRSAVASRFAAKMIQNESPGHTIETVKKLLPPDEPFILLVSHVLSEVDERALKELQDLSRAAAAVFWVEPGRSLESRRLSRLRDQLTGSHAILGPCRHSAPCGALQPGREQDWCHFFAPVPREVHHSAFWREFSQRMKVDLRSLPVAWLAAAKSAFYQGPTPPAGEALILARPRVLKGYCRWLACTEEGLCSGDFQKKHDPEIHEVLREPAFLTILDKNKLLRTDDASL